MRKYRVIKTIIALTLTVAIVLCGSVFVSAYHPIFSLKSSDWVVATDEIYSASYPDNVVMSGMKDSVFQHEELNGETYYTSKFWEDDYTVLTETEVVFPALPDGNFKTNGKSVTTGDKILFKSGDSFYIAFAYGFSMVYVTDQSYHSQLQLEFDVAGCTGEIVYYELCYPFSTWEYHSYNDFYVNTDVCVFSADNTPSAVEIIWSDVDVKTYTGANNYHSAADFDIVGSTHKIEFEKPLSVLSGALYFHIDSKTFDRLSESVTAFLFENVGFVIGTDTNFLDIRYDTTMRVNGELAGHTTLFHYNYNSSESSLFVGDKVIDDFIEVVDLSTLDFDGYGIDVVFSFSFVSNGFNLFFPGSLELVEYGSYEESEEHKEIINTIQSGFDSILNNKIGLEEVVIDTSVVDDIVQKQDEILKDVYGELDNIIDNNMPDGYEDYNDYLEDNIDYFNKNLSNAFSFVKKLFESIVEATGISYLILFCLSFGFAMYVLGRRLS